MNKKKKIISNILATQQEAGFPHIISFNKVLLIWFLINRLFNLIAVWQDCLWFNFPPKKKLRFLTSLRDILIWETLDFLIIFIVLHESPKGYILWIHWTFKPFIKLEAKGKANFFPLSNSSYGEITGMTNGGEEACPETLQALHISELLVGWQKVSALWAAVMPWGVWWLTVSP